MSCHWKEHEFRTSDFVTCAKSSAANTKTCVRCAVSDAPWRRKLRFLLRFAPISFYRSRAFMKFAEALATEKLDIRIQRWQIFIRHTYIIILRTLIYYTFCLIALRAMTTKIHLFCDTKYSSNSWLTMSSKKRPVYHCTHESLLADPMLYVNKVSV
jgi:hypothetical protein